MAVTPQKQAFTRFYKGAGKAAGKNASFGWKNAKKAGVAIGKSIAASRSRNKRTTNVINVQSGGSGPSGAQQEFAKRSVRERMVANPELSTLIIFGFYIFFVYAPFPILSFLSLSFPWLVIAPIALYILLRGHPLFALASVFVIFILLNFGLATDFFKSADVYVENLRERLKIYDPLESWKAEYGGFTNPKVEENVVKKGIEFLSFTPDDSPFYEGLPATLTAQIEIDAFDETRAGSTETMQVLFRCYEQTANGDARVEGVIYTNYAEEPNPVLEVSVSEASKHDVICSFPEGALTITATELGEFLPTTQQEEGFENLGERITQKIIVLEAQVRFSQVTSLDLFTVKKINLPPTRIPGINSDDRVTPICQSGCGSPYTLSLQTGRQPITEEMRQSLTLTFRRDYTKSLFGLLANVELISLNVPEGVVLQSEPSPCGFEIGGGPVDGATVFVPDTKLDTLNDKLEESEKSQREAGGLTQPLKYTCFYKIPNPPSNWVSKPIQARAVYDIVVRKRITVPFSRGGDLS